MAQLSGLETSDDCKSVNTAAKVLVLRADCPSTLSLRLVTVGGDEIGALNDVDMLMPGVDLKQLVAKSFNLSRIGIKLVLPSGDTVKDVPLHSQAPLLTVCTECQGDHVVVSCISSDIRPLGRKDTAVPRRRIMGSKAGMLLERHIDRNNGGESSIIELSCAPDAETAKFAAVLIKDSFAPHLAPLIELGIDAACCAKLSVDSMDAKTAEKYVYTDEQSSAVADLSSCQLWCSSLNKASSGAYSCALQFRDRATSTLVTGGLLSSILWRMLDTWEDPEACDNAHLVCAGPVLEVLFLSTHPVMRTMGEAKRMVSRLEKHAQSLGCSALAVAAVPAQGINFWTSTAHWTVVVPRDETVDSHDEAAFTLGEPTCPLGQYLLDRMVLFNDCPLVAKRLRAKKDDAIAAAAPPAIEGIASAPAGFALAPSSAPEDDNDADIEG